MSLYFEYTRNPCPTFVNEPGPKTNPVGWIVQGFDESGHDIQWTSENPAVATVEPLQGSLRHHVGIVSAWGGLGMTKITATQPDKSDRWDPEKAKSTWAYVFVGDLFTYVGDIAWHAQSNFWQSQAALPPGGPSYEAMKGHGVAWVQRAEADGGPYVVLNFQALHDVRDNLTEASFYKAKVHGHGHHAPGGSIPLGSSAYAYAPGGHPVWRVDKGDWRVWDPEVVAPPDRFPIPTKDAMDKLKAAIAWEPPKRYDAPSPDANVGLIAAVTCYILDPGQFPAPAHDGTTFYEIEKIEE